MSWEKSLRFMMGCAGYDSSPFLPTMAIRAAILNI